jgi:hypothetical protein
MPGTLSSTGVFLFSKHHACLVVATCGHDFDSVGAAFLAFLRALSKIH